MSKHHMETVTCPQCGHKEDTLVWDTINGVLSPDAKRKLIDGTLFKFTCPKCGYIANLDYQTLYHDMEHHKMVFYVPKENVDNARDAMKRSNELFSSMVKPTNRIVTEQNRLREKAFIFSEGLDDRVIEVVKLMCWAEICKQTDKISDDALYFSIMDGKYKLESPGFGVICEINKDLYAVVSQQFTPILDSMNENDMIVDNNFAGNAMLLFNQLHKDG